MMSYTTQGGMPAAGNSLTLISFMYTVLLHTVVLVMPLKAVQS